MKHCPACEGFKRWHIENGATCTTPGCDRETIKCLVCDGTGSVPRDFGDFPESFDAAPS